MSWVLTLANFNLVKLMFKTDALPSLIPYCNGLSFSMPRKSARYFLLVKLLRYEKEQILDIKTINEHVPLM
jgi:hypothetical protein